MYDIETYDEVVDALRVLSRDALLAYAEVLTLLRLAPWSGEPYHSGNPDGPMRQLAFGPQGDGVVVHLILERDRRIDVLRVFWFGRAGPMT